MYKAPLSPSDMGPADRRLLPQIHQRLGGGGVLRHVQLEKGAIATGVDRYLHDSNTNDTSGYVSAGLSAYASSVTARSDIVCSSKLYGSHMSLDDADGGGGSSGAGGGSMMTMGGRGSGYGSMAGGGNAYSSRMGSANGTTAMGETSGCGGVGGSMYGMAHSGSFYADHAPPFLPQQQQSGRGRLGSFFSVTLGSDADVEGSYGGGNNVSTNANMVTGTATHRTPPAATAALGPAAATKEQQQQWHQNESIAAHTASQQRQTVRWLPRTVDPTMTGGTIAPVLAVADDDDDNDKSLMYDIDAVLAGADTAALAPAADHRAWCPSPAASAVAMMGEMNATPGTTHTTNTSTASGRFSPPGEAELPWMDRSYASLPPDTHPIATRRRTGVPRLSARSLSSKSR